MTRAIFYKEWIKLRWLLLAISLVFAGSIPYFILNLTNKFRFAGKPHFWSVIVGKDLNLISELTYIPLLAGLILGLAQFVPEMQKKSLKLTLHLPHPEKLTILKMLLFGSGTLVSIFSITGLVLYLSLSIYLPSQILVAWFTAALAWYLAGLAAYFLAVWVCIEPVWKQKAINTLLAIAVIMLFFKGTSTYSLQYAMPLYIGIILLSMCFPFYSVFRFKEGVQQ
ncbi:hypothetical protein KDU71_02015 [Carboxylicivirga sediminis]|uniref:Uncharacterized protein n=1 Tax=Carboxylicivirga sediminis TaxID=2006564 RepID=A0A941EZA7_9BACT|nr:hypothetical protein [Carboxylicivirga sediminis]MBR8534318.1 hypothetical protein [Carboxylicivirga sediminis]